MLRFQNDIFGLCRDTGGAVGRHGERVYNAEKLSMWIVPLLDGSGEFDGGAHAGRAYGTILQRFMCRLTLAYLMDEEVDRAWIEYVNVLDAMQTVDAEGTCPICFESMDEGVQLKCSHVFHDVCLSRWFMETTTCPMCRYDVTT